MHCRSLEHDFSERVDALTGTGLPRIRDAAGGKGHRLAAAVFDVGKLAIMSDLRFREAERVEALELDHGRATAAREIAMFRNAACLELLRDELRPAIAAVREEFGEPDGYTRDETNPAFYAFEREARDALMGIDLNMRRARAAGRTLSRLREMADQEGIPGLCGVLDRHCERLIELREDRPSHNGPVGWVIGGAIAATGFAIIGICSAVSTGRLCRNPLVNFIGGVHIGVGLFVIAISGGQGEDPGSDSDIDIYLVSEDHGDISEL